MYQRTSDLSAPLLEEGHQQNSTGGSSSYDDEHRLPVRTRKRPRRDFDCTPTFKIRCLALYLVLSFLFVYSNGSIIGMVAMDSSAALGFSAVSLVVFLVMVLPLREWNRPAGTCCHPGTNLASITAMAQSQSPEGGRVQTPTFVLRKVMRDACNGICSRLKVIIFLLSISLLWATIFISAVHGLSQLIPDGEIKTILRHALKQLVTLGNADEGW